MRTAKEGKFPMRKISLLLVAALMATFLVASPAAAARPGAEALSIPVTGNFTDTLGGVGTFTGELDITRFAVRDGDLTAIGSLTGTLTDSLGAVIGTVTRAVAIPVADISGTCDILHLELGPLNLDLLGLVVHLDQVVLDITAEQGPGNLLGNLLCAVAGLLDGGLNLNGLARLLNQILSILG
jgi:hypothetical protein